MAIPPNPTPADHAEVLADLLDLYKSAKGGPTWTAKTGEYQAPSNQIVAVSTAMGANNGLCSFVPFNVGPLPETFDRFAINVGTALSGGAAVAMRGGLYADDGSGAYPAGLITDYGVFAALTAGLQFISINAALDPGRYWLGVLYTYTTAPTALSVFHINSSMALPGSFWTNNYRGRMLTGQAAGAMPASGAAAIPAASMVVSAAMRAA